jgi:uncharacterized SAM-binding protein YcdF (DUF218 family)
VTYLDWGLCSLLFLFAVRQISGRGSRRNVLGWAVLAGLFLWSWPPSTALFAYSLESWYPATRFPDGDAGAIVVLGGSVHAIDVSQPEALPLYDTYVRCRHAAWLYRNWKALPVVASGGETSGPTRLVIADVMRQTLIEAGVPDAMIWTEGRSRSTYENALFTSRLLREKGIHRIALVTEGHHLPRSIQCFRKQGIDAAPAGCDYRHLAFNGRWQQFFPSAQMIHNNEDTLHEWAGLAWYRVSGKT